MENVITLCHWLFPIICNNREEASPAVDFVILRSKGTTWNSDTWCSLIKSKHKCDVTVYHVKYAFKSLSKVRNIMLHVHYRYKVWGHIDISFYGLIIQKYTDIIPNQLPVWCVKRSLTASRILLVTLNGQLMRAPQYLPNRLQA